MMTTGPIPEDLDTTIGDVSRFIYEDIDRQHLSTSLFQNRLVPHAFKQIGLVSILIHFTVGMKRPQ